MFETRKVVAVVLLLAFSVGLTASLNGLDRWLCEPWETPESLPYLPGLESAVVGLLIHVYLIRRIWPIDQKKTMGVGLLVSGLISVAFWVLFLALLEHPKDLVWIIATFSYSLFFACFLSFLWFPFLMTVEHWADCREQARGSLTKSAEELP